MKIERINKEQSPTISPIASSNESPKVKFLKKLPSTKLKPILFHKPIEPTPPSTFNIDALLQPQKEQFTYQDWEHVPYLLQHPLQEKYRKEVLYYII